MAKVYVKTDEKRRVIEINSDIFLSDTAGWTQVDEGDGDKYAHAQSNYLNKPLIDEGYNYKIVEGELEERSKAEKEADRQEETRPITIEDRVNDLESALVGLVYGGGII